MQTIQKLEIGAGIATSASVLLWLFLYIGFALSTDIFSSENTTEEFFVWCVFILQIWVISLIVAFGAYYDATKQSRGAVVALAIGAISIICISGFCWFFALAQGGGGKIHLIFIAPAILAFLTGIFAFAARD